MTHFTSWIKKAITSVIDPDKQQRVDRLVVAINQSLNTKRQGFLLSDAIQGLDATPADIDQAKEIVYRTLLNRGWQDGQLTQSEQAFANWVAHRLELPHGVAQRLNAEFAKHFFATVLAKAMEDGHIDSAEEAKLSEIAATMQLSLQQFARHFFMKESESFLRGVFAACVAQNRLDQQHWQHLISTAGKLGIEHDEFLRCIEVPARQFVEHVLADAKSDEELSPHEEQTLAWLLNNLRLDQSFRNYVATEANRLKTITQISQGHLPSLIPPSNLGIRSGELVHLHERALLRKVKVLKSGTRSEDHNGTITLTDNRLIFSSTTRSDSWNLRRIVSHRTDGTWIEIQVEGKPANLFAMHQPDDIHYRILATAIAMANQTLVRKSDTTPTRHIPRDVRQRVWQLYGGRCAECGADNYLEFDHIVPAAKGGSNSDANVQLLCRQCNLKKRDHI